MSTIVIPQRFSQRYDTVANWEAKNSVLWAGEIAYGIDDQQHVVWTRVGDGVHGVNDLPDVGGGAASPMPVNVQAGTAYTAQASDAGADVQCANAAPITLTLPNDVFKVGDWLLVSQTGDGIVTIVGASGVTFESTGTNATIGKGDVVGLELIAPNVWRFIGGAPDSGGISDAPADGNLYGRKNKAWAAFPSLGALAALNDQTGMSYTIKDVDAGSEVRCTNAAAIALNIDTQAHVPVRAGFWALVSQGGAGIVTVTGLTGVVLRAPNGAATTKQYDARGIQRIAGDEWRVW